MSVPVAVLRWRLLAILLVLGGLTGAMTMMLPHPGSFDETGIWAAIAAALTAGAIALAGAGRLPGFLIPVTLFLSTGIITLAAYSTGQPGSWFAFFYVWVSIYSFYFLERRWAFVQVAAIGAAYAILVAVVPERTSSLSEWVVVMATVGVTAALVDTLVQRSNRIAASLRSIAAERTALAQRLDRLASTDELTGLPNRRGWELGLEREIARAARTGEPLCVALLDLDHFKLFNDRHGHLAGDEFLRSLAPAWRDHLRDSDLLIRFGGEEFALALPDCGLVDAEILLERLRGAVPRGQSASAGVARWNGAESAGELVDRADRALYEAKRHGRDRVTAAA